MRDNNNQRERDNEFVERVIQIKRVSKKTSGGNTISFAALVVVGDMKGQVGVGYGKARDVSTAIAKGIGSAKKSLVKVPINNGTISHEIEDSYGSAHVLLKPSSQGAGVIAGGTVRIVVELAGIKDISAKMLGSSNKICNIRCTINALSKLKK
ncbi:30S ribosomal protein S5 [candidate division WWE3 bacterium]|uniref:Small ribosomal subunit protein uS5 n=1 Tax=candidate division WWE3 bacterium TaxID=2053526 RepID=A0A7X9DK83_UNCKA|nr:30S ribosomal protein S5 [candidate division WWE3 bacterium]